MDLREEYARRAADKSDISLHLPVLFEAVATRQKPVVVELGTRSGNSTAALLAAAEQAGGQVWSVDNDPAVSPAVFPWGEHPAWHFTLGDSVSPEVLSVLPERIDVLFVDTSHTYEQTLAECHAWIPRIVAGGIALFHDTQYHPCYNFQEDYDLGEPTGPVSRALNTYCKESGLTWENRSGSYGLGILAVPA